jgi:ABC-type uncharacterized transport system substrate-binding protein
VEHQNIVIERRYTESRKEAALAVAEELVRLRVDVIVVASTLTALAAKQATTTVPTPGSFRPSAAAGRHRA